jgi:hypothetical protein
MSIYGPVKHGDLMLSLATLQLVLVGTRRFDNRGEKEGVNLRTVVRKRFKNTVEGEIQECNQRTIRGVR